MNSLEVVRLYKEGYSIEYIVNKFFTIEKLNNKIITTNNKKLIIINCPVKKTDIRSNVYKIIYNEKMKKDRSI